MNTRQFVNKYHISADVEYADENPNMNSDPNWQANHYKVTLKIRRDGLRKQFTTFFSCGLGIKDEPTAADVLDCIASDVSSVDNARDFEDWAADLGYDPDSRKAERTYRIVQRQGWRLVKFLGVDLEAELMEADRL